MNCESRRDSSANCALIATTISRLRRSASGAAACHSRLDAAVEIGKAELEVNR